MLYTIKLRKELNALFLHRHQPTGFTLQNFGGCERMLLDQPPQYAIKLDDVRRAESLAAKYWLRFREPMPVLVRVVSNARTGQEAYDVNYLNPNRPHDIELVERYISHTTVYAIDSYERVE